MSKNKRIDTYSHYNKDDKKLDRRIKEVRRGDYQSPTNNEGDASKVEGRNAIIELLKSDREVNKVLIAKGDRQGSINDIIKLCKDKGIVF